jgi:hypothetical protein
MRFDTAAISFYCYHSRLVHSAPAADRAVSVAPGSATLTAGRWTASGVVMDNHTAAAFGAGVEALAMDQDMAVARRAAGHSSFLWLREL